MKLIPLTQGKFAIVDDEDYEWLMQWKWYANKIGKTFYAMRGVNVKGKHITVLMHREIMKKHYPLLLTAKMDIDHIDRNGLGNQKQNLRICTRSQNNQNQQILIGKSSKYKGAVWHKNSKLWMSRIKINRQQILIGYFHNEVDAALAYDSKAKELFGEFARPNF